MAIIKQRTNKSGKHFAIIFDSVTRTYGVFRLCENYDGKVRGGIRKTWRYVKGGIRLDLAAAHVLFDKKAPAAKVLSH